MKFFLIVLMLLGAEVQAHAQPVSYKCDVISVNGRPERPVSAVFMLEKPGRVRLVMDGESLVITDRHFSLEKTHDSFVLTKYNGDIRFGFDNVYRKVFKQCEITK